MMVPVCELLKKGAFFECQVCGYCCSQKEGNIYIFPEEVPALVDFLLETGMIQSKREFFERYVTVTTEAYHKKIMETIVIRQRENGECIFFDNPNCLIYPHRPFQCVGFPFWAMNVEDDEDWEGLKEICPGIDKGNRFYSKQEIDELLKRERKLEEDYYKLMRRLKFDIRRVYPDLPEKTD